MGYFCLCRTNPARSFLDRALNIKCFSLAFSRKPRLSTFWILILTVAGEVQNGNERGEWASRCSLCMSLQPSRILPLPSSSHPAPPSPSSSSAAAQERGDKTLQLRHTGGVRKPGIRVAISDSSLLPDCGLGSDVLLIAPRRRLVEADDRVVLVDLVTVDVSKEASGWSMRVR